MSRNHFPTPSSKVSYSPLNYQQRRREVGRVAAVLVRYPTFPGGLDVREPTLSTTGNSIFVQIIMSTEVQTAVKVETSIEKSVKRQREARRSVNLGSGGGGLAGGGGKGRQKGGAGDDNKGRQKGGGGDDGRHKFNRKRSQSFAGGRAVFLPHKKRKKEGAVPPTKFLLGGNIRDPLNLNSLQDEEINRRMNAVTPESSPLPTPQHRKGEIEVIIPANIRDPLSLADEEDNDAYAASFRTAQLKRVGRKKHKKKKPRSSTGSGKEDNADFKSDESKGDEAIEQDIKKNEQESKQADQSEADKGKVESKDSEVPAKPHVLDLNVKDPLRRISKGSDSCAEKAKPVRKLFDGKDKIVSPVIPQPGAWLDRHAPHKLRKQEPRPVQKTPKFKEQDKKFQYGNYHRYYGYRNPSQEVDPRLKMLARVDSLFLDKDVLDVGCNMGNVAVCVARDLGARKVVGLDIDRALIEKARCSLKKFSGSQGGAKYPVSMPLVYGSLDVPGLPHANHFPHNLSFIQGNYVLESDVLLELEHPQFDVILCLSVTKWFQLNWGDAGLKRVFQRMFRQLRPGGKLILEAQSYSSYKRKKNLTETIWRNYQSIKLLPNQFTEYLLSEVGFSKCEVIGSPYHSSKGFQRPIKIFSKSMGSPWTEAVLPSEDSVDEPPVSNSSDHQRSSPVVMETETEAATSELNQESDSRPPANVVIPVEQNPDASLPITSANY